MFQEIEGGHRLELKYIMYFVASASKHIVAASFYIQFVLISQLQTCSQS